MTSSLATSGASQVGLVVERIRERIRTGRLSPGQRLVETELTRELGVSRGPVREALRRLEAEGLIEITRHRGASVRQMTRADVLELFAVREMLEGGAARLAALNIDAGDSRSRLRQVLAESKRWVRARDVVGYVEANEEFHNLVLEVADNTLLATMVNQLQVQAYRILFLEIVSLEGIRKSARGHVEIAGAILDGDGSAAEAAMRGHIHRTVEDTLQMRNPWFA